MKQFTFLSSQTRARFSGESRGFTVTELLVVVAIIALLLALVLVGFRKAKLMAKTVSCLSNQRQISLAQVSYAADNGGAYASNRTSGFTQPNEVSFTLSNTCGSFPILINQGRLTYDSYHSWTASYTTNMNGTQELETAITKGRLFPYVGSLPAYKSPLDPTDRFRSYSLNSFVGGTVPEDSQEWANKWHTWFCSQGVTPKEWVSTHVVHHKFPSQTIMSIIEDDSDGFAYNNQGWCIDPRPPLGSIAPPGTPNPGQWANSGGWEGWVDWPAFWEPTSITYSYVDGSTESYSMQNKSIVTSIQGPPGAGFGHRWAQPADNAATGPWRRDWMHFRERLMPGVIPPMIPRFQAE
jgi:prepilin-type N-terminal cleavage/methylation domain-containing protein